MVGRPFVKGAGSPNPNGRSKEMRAREKRLSEYIRGLAGDNCEAYAERLHQLVMNTGSEPKDVIKGIEMLWTRALGKPTEHFVIEDEQPELTPEQIAETEHAIALEQIAKMSRDERERLLAMGEHAGETVQ